MIPSKLDDWDLASVQDLLTKGYYESEYFDFKEMLPHPQDNAGKLRLRKTCCAFANSAGGFLVFGITDSRTAPIVDRLVGIDPNQEFPRTFGAYPQECRPSIDWSFLNPPIALPNGRVLHVVHVPRSWNAPHGCNDGHGGWAFTKRTNQGDEPMSFEEVRLLFLQYYEKRLKLQLLQAELNAIRRTAEGLKLPPEQWETAVVPGSFDLTVLETVLADTYTILSDQQELLAALSILRQRCRTISSSQQIIYPAFHLPLSNKDRIMRQHNEMVARNCEAIIDHCDRALHLLSEMLATI